MTEVPAPSAVCDYDVGGFCRVHRRVFFRCVFEKDAELAALREVVGVYRRALMDIRYTNGTKRIHECVTRALGKEGT